MTYLSVAFFEKNPYFYEVFFLGLPLQSQRPQKGQEGKILLQSKLFWGIARLVYLELSRFWKKNLLLNSFSGPLLQFFKTFSKGMIPGTKEEFIELDSGPLLLFHSVQLLQPKIMTLVAK